MELNTNTALTTEPEQPEAKLISTGHLASYLKRIKDGRKRRGFRYSMEIILVLSQLDFDGMNMKFHAEIKLSQSITTRMTEY